MTICYHCGEQKTSLFKCEMCGKKYCNLHKEPIDHECNLVQEQNNYDTSNQYYSQPESIHHSEDINTQRFDYSSPQSYQEPQHSVQNSSMQQSRGTTDGSFTWYRREKYVPENAFDPSSGIEFKGILMPYKSEFLHLIIGSLLIFTIGFIAFYPQLAEQNMVWAVFMLAGFYTTAFLFHEFGHRQVAKHFGLQTKFRLLTFGMILTVAGLVFGLFSILTGSIRIPSLALPGAVVVLGLDKVNRKSGLCKVAGPTINLFYGLILFVVSLTISPNDFFPLNLFIGYAAALNFTLGSFNMIPVGILDGENIWKWNKGVYLSLMLSLLILLITTYGLLFTAPQQSIYYPSF